MSKDIEEIARAMAVDQAKRHYGIDRGSDEAWEALTEYGRNERLAEAQAAYSVMEKRLGELEEAAIALRRLGDFAVVSVLLKDGRDIELIRERYDGNFSHIIEPSGITRRIEEGC
jgi:hypothetical protein